MLAAPAIFDLVVNTYGNYLLDSEMRWREFALLGRLLQEIPVYRVWPSDDPSLVSEMCLAIAERTRGSGRHAVAS
jgi:hypothetical protein